MENLTEKDDEFWYSWKGLCVFIFFVVVLWILNLITMMYLFPQIEPDSDLHWSLRGTAGDMFGAATSLFSGLAFEGLIFTLIIQRRELTLQRKELSFLVNEQKETRIVIEGQRLQMELQSKSIAIQNFENKFFQLIDVFNKYISDICITRGDRPPHTGRDALEIISKRVLGYVYAQVNNKNQTIEQAYEKIFSNHDSDLGAYFRILYNILKFVDESNVEDKFSNTRIIRAQLSPAELKLVLFNCSNKYGVEKMKPLVEKYSILKHCTITDEIEISLANSYNISAFGGVMLKHDQ